MTFRVTRTCSKQNGFARQLLIALGLWTGFLSPASALPASDQELVLAIQPILSESNTRKAYQPLANYIEKVTGRKCSIKTTPNFLAYWSEVTRSRENMIYVDAAHFTAYRARKQGYQVLAKVPDSVSYSLIVSDNNIIFDPTELTAKRVATLGAPSIGAARLNGMFPNPVRQPIIVEVANAETGIKMVIENKVDAAIIPTPIVSSAMSQGTPINVVTTTEPMPHIAVSTSPDIDSATTNKIRQALLQASDREDGQAMLQQIGFPKFDPANGGIYQNQDNILKTYWGF
jgi:ABC-type phosphate/phosphonate transport system substrate-binding protein